MHSYVNQRQVGGWREHTQQQAPCIPAAACRTRSLHWQWLLGCQFARQASRSLCRQQTCLHCESSAKAAYRRSVKVYSVHLQLAPDAAIAWQSNSLRVSVQSSVQISQSKQISKRSRHTSSRRLGTLHRHLVSAAGLDANHVHHESSRGSLSPSSLHYIELLPHPAATDSYSQLLCNVLHIQPSDAQLLLLTSPAVVTLTPQQMRSNWNKLQQLLPVKPHMLLKLLLQLPDLLLRPEDTVHSRLREASEVLQRPVYSLRSRQHRLTPTLHWNLLRMERQQLVDRLVQLEQLLGLRQQQSSQQRPQQPAKQQGHNRHQAERQSQMQQVAALVCDEPRLLIVDQMDLVSTLEAIEQVCSWPVARLLPGLLRRPQLLMRPADKLYQAATALQHQLKLSEEGLALVLKRVPGALLVSPPQLEALLLELSRSLAVSVEVAMDICLQEPQLLLRRPGAVGRVLTVMQSVFNLTSEELLQVVEFDPSILSRSPGELAATCGKFKALALSHKPWAAEYRRLMSRPVNVARALRIEPLRLHRLSYLQEQKLARTSSLKAAVSMSGRQFSLAYPGYKRWLAVEYSAGGVPGQLRNDIEEADDHE